ncbi:retrovirus-related pol polyprotein from transposon TNT 1-94, partial [Tanacetum coccineum]
TKLLSGIEDSHHGPSDAMHNPSQPLKVSKLVGIEKNIRVMPKSIHSDDGNPSRANIKQAPCVKKDIDDIETINIDLEHRVAKLIAENEHLKQTYKQLYDSIKPSRVHSKEHAEFLVNQLNQKSVEITDLNAQLQEKVFVIKTLQNDLRKFKGKDIVDNAAQVSNATTIAPGLYKLDPVTLAPKDKNNRETHIYYLKHNMEQAVILMEIVEQAKSLNPLDSASYSACKYVKLMQELLGYVRDTCPNNYKPSEKLVAVTPINKKKTVSFMFDTRHELCFLEFVSDMNASSKSKSVKKAKKKEEWKPIGKVFTKIGYNWRPTGRTFPLVRNACPLTRITSTNKVPLREPIPLEVVAQESVVTKVYTRRPKVPKNNGSNSKPKIAKYVISNRTEPGTSRGSNTSFAPSSSSLLDLRYYENVGISNETSVARSPQQNGVVERRNHTLVKAAQTMLIYAKDPLFLWVEAIATAYYIQNRSLIWIHHGNTPYELLHDIKPNLSYLHIFRALCYPNNDSKDLGKLQAKLTAMAFEQLGLEPGLQIMTPATSSSGLVTNPIPQQPCNRPILDDWDRLLQPMFDEYFNPPTIAVSLVLVVAAPRAVDLADSHVSTSIDQDDPSIMEKNKLDEDIQGTPVDATLYHGMIGSLMYLTSSRPDLIYADTDMSLTAYVDADHTGCQDTRRSTSRSAQVLALLLPTPLPEYPTRDFTMSTSSLQAEKTVDPTSIDRIP